jgi:adenine phosphoribosyltransferase
MPDRLLAALRTVPDFPQPGIQFRDISPLLADPALRGVALDQLADPWQAAGISTIIGIESRGFLFGMLLAERIGAGFAMARKPGKLPAKTVREVYDLEYGNDAIELHADAVQPGERVLIHDDVIATGGTAVATARLVERLGGEVAGFSFLIELAALGGRSHLPVGIPVRHVLTL